METVLYILVALAGATIVLPLAAKLLRRDDDPLDIHAKRVEPLRRSPIFFLLGMARWASKILLRPVKIVRRPKGDHILARFAGFKFLFGHPEMEESRRVRLYLEKKRLVLYSRAFSDELASVPLNRITGVIIEKPDQARVRHARSGKPLAGVVDDYLTGKQHRHEYIFSVHWDDDRGMSHDSVFRYRRRSLRIWGFGDDPADIVTGIRNKIISAKPPIGHPDYLAPQGEPDDAKDSRETTDGEHQKGAGSDSNLTVFD